MLLKKIAGFLAFAAASQLVALWLCTVGGLPFGSFGALVAYYSCLIIGLIAAVVSLVDPAA